MFFLKTIYFFSILFSFSSYAGNCKEQFEYPPLHIQEEIPFKFISSSYQPQKTFGQKSSVVKKQALTRKQIKQNFLSAFQSRDIKQLKELVLKQPFLKKTRWPVEQSPVHKEHQNWIAEGWTPLQIASYLKDLELLNLFLELDFNVRTKKKTGGVSIEDNALHIAIKRNFLEGAESLLNHMGFVRFGRRNRFIDEKTHDKYTPWALAIQHYEKYGNLDFIRLIGRHQPSGYTESYDSGIPKDGYVLANETRSSEVIRMANMYLIAPKYEHYREIKQNHPYPFHKRTSSPSWIK